MLWINGVMKEQRQRSTWPEKAESDGDSLSARQGGGTAEIAGLRFSPLAQLFLNSPCPAKQDDRGEEKKKGRTWVNRKPPHHCRRASDTLKVSS